MTDRERNLINYLSAPMGMSGSRDAVRDAVYGRLQRMLYDPEHFELVATHEDQSATFDSTHYLVSVNQEREGS